MRLGWRSYTAAVTVLCCAAWLARVGYLNFTGYCRAEGRYLDRQEFIDAAARYNLSRYDPVGERSLKYESLQDFYAKNPNCCDFFKSLHYDQNPNYMRIFGFYNVAVGICYKMNDKPDTENFYSSEVIVDACGKVRKTSGMPYFHGPGRVIPRSE